MKVHIRTTVLKYPNHDLILNDLKISLISLNNFSFFRLQKAIREVTKI